MRGRWFSPILKILFLHHNFPGQFRWIASHLATVGCDVVFLTEANLADPLPGVRHVAVPVSHPISHSSIDGQLACANRFLESMKTLKASGWCPDTIVSHSGWGCGLDASLVFPKAKIVSYLEWWFSDQCSDYTFDPNSPWWQYSEDTRFKLRRRNLSLSLELAEADTIIAPTNWQRSQLPICFQDRCTVIHEGVDTNYFVMNPKWRPSDRIRITYATRGMEQMRGFPHFIEAISEVLSVRKNLEVVIAGTDKVAYGSKVPKEGSFGKWARSILKPWIEQGVVKFVGALPKQAYARLLKSSHVRGYLTRPFVLSWSLLDSMASGCQIVCSDVPPVREVAHPVASFWADHTIRSSLVSAICKAADLTEHQRFANGLSQRHVILSGYTRQQSLVSWLRVLQIPDVT